MTLYKLPSFFLFVFQLCQQNEQLLYFSRFPLKLPNLARRTSYFTLDERIYFKAAFFICLADISDSKQSAK